MAAFIHLLRNAAHRAFAPGFGFVGEGCRGSGPAPLPPKPRIGLALSSGAAKGLAHIGVIQVLEEHGIEADIIAGTSMGAYVGSLYAAGFKGPELEELAVDLETSRDVFRLVDPAFPPRRGFLYGKRVTDRLRRSLGSRRIEDLPKALRIVATELHTFREHVFREGDVVDAVWASIAIPGVCVPVELNGTEFVDGAVVNPMPVNLAREQADIVIAVTVLPTLSDMAGKSQADLILGAEMPASIWRAAGLWLNQHMNYFAQGNLLDILRQSAFGSQIRLLDRAAAEADVLIRASVHGANWHDYHNAPEYIARGRAAALEMIPAIQARIAAFATPKPETEKLCA